MTDKIKPDTSLYTDLPNKLRAFIAVIESGSDMEVMITNDRGWETTMPATDANRLESLSRGNQYRTKPKPRELWAPEFKSGALGASWDTKAEALRDMGAVRAIRFVEQPE
jgi:hypothetical protein